MATRSRREPEAAKETTLARQACPNNSGETKTGLHQVLYSGPLRCTSVSCSRAGVGESAPPPPRLSPARTP